MDEVLESEKKSKRQFRFTKKRALVIFTIYLIAISFLTITPNDAKNIAEDSLSTLVANQGGVARATSVDRVGGLYVISLDVGDGSQIQKLDAFLSSDGNTLIIGNAINTKSLGDSVVEPTKIEVEIQDGDLSLGDPNAPITMIEFSDFQCPFCRRFWSDTLKDIKTNYIDTGKVYFIYKDFPLSFHPAAKKSAEAVECANEQGVWLEMHDKIFEEQNKLGSGTVQYSTDDIKNWAKDVVSDYTAWEECLDSGKYVDEIQEDFENGQAAGVSGTPASIVNGVIISGAQPYSVFENAFEQELNS